MAGRDLAREVTPGAAVTPSATATARGSPRSTPASRPRSSATSSQRGARSTLHPCTTTADELLAARPRRDLPGQRPRRPGRARLRRRHGARARRQEAGVGHLPRPPAALPRGRPGDVQAARSATAAPTTRSRTSRPAGSRSPRQNHGFAVVGPGGAQHDRRPTSRCAGRPTSAPPQLSHVNLYDRTVEGLDAARRRRRGTVQYHPEAGPGPARRPVPLRPLPRARPARRCRAATTSSRILILGSGPIVIGQAAEFDYSGVQACKVLREEGYEVVLVNSNPATIMTDPEFADATYVEPLLPGPGRADHREGAPRRAAADARRPDRAEPRQGAARGRHARALRRRAHRRELRRDRPRRGPRPVPRRRWRRPGCGCRAARSRTTLDEALGGARRRRPAGDHPPGVHARRPRRRRSPAPRRSSARSSRRGLDASPIGQVLLDQSVIGWGEFELEVMRDHNDNVRDRLLDREHRPDGRAHRRLASPSRRSRR